MRGHCEPRDPPVPACSAMLRCPRAGQLRAEPSPQSIPECMQPHCTRIHLPTHPVHILSTTLALSSSPEPRHTDTETAPNRSAHDLARQPPGPAPTQHAATNMACCHSHSMLPHTQHAATHKVPFLTISDQNISVRMRVCTCNETIGVGIKAVGPMWQEGYCAMEV